MGSRAFYEVTSVKIVAFWQISGFMETNRRDCSTLQHNVRTPYINIVDAHLIDLWYTQAGTRNNLVGS